MDQNAIIDSTSVAPPEKFPARQRAGFWRRLFALVVDVLLLSPPSFLLGYFFSDFFASSSVWTAAIGFIITIPYFALMGSSIGGGQTVGQRWTGIEVVDRQGNHLSLGRSFLRYTILFGPLLFSEGTLPSYIGWPIGMVEFAVLYLYIFNTRTRQTLHDIVTSSFVVETDGIGAIELASIWRGHWIILAALFLSDFAVWPMLTNAVPFSELFAVRQALLDSGTVREVGVMFQTQNPGSRTGLILTVTCKSKPVDYERTGAAIVAIAEKADPEAAQRDFIAVDFKEGFHVGLANFSKTQRVNHSPQQWEEIIQREAR